MHERVDRRTERGRADRGWRPGQDGGLDPVSYVDAPASEQPYGFVD
jgi:hypothetical protein